MNRRGFLAASATLLAGPARVGAEQPGASSPTEIRIGNTIPYSGPASAYGAVGKAQLAYIAMVNDQGGVNGRQIRLVTLDNEYSPPKALELTRKLVEQEGVLAISGTLGTPTNAAIQKYLNDSRVPHIFIISGASRWGDPKYPWSMGLVPSYRTEGGIYADYALAQNPHSKIAVLYQNDDLGKDGVRGVRERLGKQTEKVLVATASYEVSDPTIDSQIATLHGSGADILMMFTTPKFAAQAIRKTWDIGWRPLRFLNGPSDSVDATLRPAGLDRSVGIVGGNVFKDAADPQWSEDPDMRDWLAWMRKYVPGGDPTNGFYVTGYVAAQLLVQALKQCGDDTSRSNVMRQALNLDLELPMLLPGIRVRTSASHPYAIRQMRLAKFNGRYWELFGPVQGG